MLDLCKEILVKVSFDRALFQKELMKALRWISKEDVAKFREWCTLTFGKKYPTELQLAFARA